jgi:hypothetical protein
MEFMNVKEQVQLATEQGLTQAEEIKPGQIPSWKHTTPSGTRWRIWYSAYNRNIPWRTARISKRESNGITIDYFNTHASHTTLQEAITWLKKLD